MSKWIKLIIFTTVFALLFGGLNFRFVHTDFYQTRENHWYYENMTRGIKLAVFGTSHMVAGVEYPSAPDVHMMNFSHLAQYPSTDWLLLKNYADMLADDCVVIISLSHFVLYGVDEETIMENQKMVYYSLLPVEDIPQHNLKDAIFYKYLPLLSAGTHVRDLFEPQGGYHMNAYHFEGTLYETAFSEEELVETKIEDWFGSHLRDGQQLRKKQVDSIYNMLDLCIERGWKPVVITPPIPLYTQEAFPKGFLPQFYRDIEEVFAPYGDIPFLDYARDPVFADHPALFYDADHLNADGSDLFTKTLVADLREMGLLAPAA